MKWYVYILKCKGNLLYTGVTNDLKKRFEAHKAGTGARFTKYNKPIKIMYSKTYKNRSLAQKKETEIKSWPRKKKLDLIKKG